MPQGESLGAIAPVLESGRVGETLKRGLLQRQHERGGECQRRSVKKSAGKTAEFVGQEEDNPAPDQDNRRR